MPGTSRLAVSLMIRPLSVVSISASSFAFCANASATLRSTCARAAAGSADHFGSAFRAAATASAASWAVLRGIFAQTSPVAGLTESSVPPVAGRSSPPIRFKYSRTSVMSVPPRIQTFGAQAYACSTFGWNPGLQDVVEVVGDRDLQLVIGAGGRGTGLPPAPEPGRMTEPGALHRLGGDLAH